MAAVQEAAVDPARVGWTRPTRVQRVALVVAVCFLVGVVGWMVGRGRDAPAGSASVGFLFDMISHHEQAIAMSQIEMFDGEVRDVQVFADEIVRFQSYEIGLMEGHLARLGHTRYEVPDEAMGWMGEPVARDSMPGLASEAEMDVLREADAPDAAFITLMIDHHAGGVAMAEAAAREAGDGAVRELAERMARVQRAEIGELLQAAKRAGLTVPAEGLTWDVYGAGDEHGGGHD